MCVRAQQILSHTQHSLTRASVDADTGQNKRQQILSHTQTGDASEDMSGGFPLLCLVGEGLGWVSFLT